MGLPMEKIGFVYDAGFRNLDYGSGHIMRGDRYERALNEFKVLGLDSSLKTIPPRQAMEDELLLFHTRDYVEKVKSLNTTTGVPIGPDTPSFPGIFDVANLSVGASLTAADLLLNDSFEIAGNICGGWHHAFSETGRGFCIFNDIVITAEYILQRGKRKILILDYDAHHGDGTQKAFYNRPDVLTISIHENPETLYPYMTGFEHERGEGKGLGFNFNIPMPPYATDELFLLPFQQFIPKVLDSFQPDVILLQMGVDGHCDCVISHLHYSLLGYQGASRVLTDWVHRHHKKLLFLGGGGFVHPMLGRAWGIQLTEFAGRSVALNVEGDRDHCFTEMDSSEKNKLQEILNKHLEMISSIQNDSGINT